MKHIKLFETFPDIPSETIPKKVNTTKSSSKYLEIFLDRNDMTLKDFLTQFGLTSINMYDTLKMNDNEIMKYDVLFDVNVTFNKIYFYFKDNKNRFKLTEYIDDNFSNKTILREITTINTHTYLLVLKKENYEQTF